MNARRNRDKLGKAIPPLRDLVQMLYTHLSNGLLNVVLEGYDQFSREDVISFVNLIVKCSLSLFR